MAENTEIAWTDATFNPWIGCTRVSPGCDNCYAEADFGSRKRRAIWGAGNPRSRTSSENWKNPRRWDRQHEAFAAEHGRRRRVFCASLGDVFDKEVPEEWRLELWALIRETQNLDWLLLTKRAPNIRRFLPDDWGEGYPHVWLGVSVEDRKHGLPRIRQLREVPARVRFLSCEPLLEDLGELDLEGIHWVIVGGESGPQARPMDREWIANIQYDCEDEGIAFFCKQLGGSGRDKGGCLLDGREFKEWPVDKV